jgi:hypothetical protein
MGLSFTVAAGPRQRSHSQFRVLRDSWPHFTLSDSRFPQPGGPGPRIYIPQEQGGQVTYIPRHWVPFSSSPTTRAATADVFDPPFTRVFMVSPHPSSLYSLGKDRTENTTASRVVYRLLRKYGSLFNEFISCLLFRNLATVVSFSYPVTVLCFYCFFLWEYISFMK